METLTDAEVARLRRYLNGARYSGAARRKLGEFAEAKGWSDEERQEVIAALSLTPL